MKSRSIAAIAAVTFAVVGCNDSTSPKARTCDRGTLAHAAVTSGTLASGGCTSALESGAWADYTVNLTDGERYLFSVRSETAWSPSLELINPADPLADRRLGWSDAVAGAGAHSELMFVSPYTGPVTLRVRGTTNPGAYVLVSRDCGGSSHEIFTSGTVATTGTIGTDDCVMHDRLLAPDSAHIETFVLYLGRYESKTVTVKARGASVGIFHPMIAAEGPFIVGLGGLPNRMVATSSGDSLSVYVNGTGVAGDFILAVGGRTSSDFGDYTLTVGPGAP